MKRRVAAKLAAEAAGRQLLEYLSSRFAYHTPTEWQQKILNSEIALDSSIVRDPQTLLQSDMLLEYFPENLTEPPVATSYRIVYEDECLLVIDKPGNLPVHPAGPYFAHTLWALLADDGYGKVHFVNRLDRETSGLLIAAKTGKIAGEISKSLAEMEKCYYVLVHGDFPEQLHACGFLVPDKDSPIKKKLKFVENAVDAFEAMAVETYFARLEKRNGFSLLSARLLTGRMHQIRATLRGVGYPVAGDKLYGLDEQFYRRFALGCLSNADRDVLKLPRQALHCCKLQFIHPSSGKSMTFSSQLPPEINALLQ